MITHFSFTKNAFKNVICKKIPILFRSQWVNSLAPGKFEWNFMSLIFQIISVIDGWGISCELTLRWMSLDLTNDKSTLVQVMAWCHQATSHYLSQCWPRSMSPYGTTRPQWVNPMQVVYSHYDKNLHIVHCPHHSCLRSCDTRSQGPDSI